MKSHLVILGILAFSITANGQLKVCENGNVMLSNGTTSNAISPLSIGYSGINNYMLAIQPSGQTLGGIFVNNLNTLSSIGVAIKNSVSSSSTGITYGLYSNFNTTGPSSSKSIGVFGKISNGAALRLGVAGNIIGSSGKGAALFGSTTSSLDIAYNARFAGYFIGDVLATGHIYGTVLSSYPTSALSSNNVGSAFSSLEDWEIENLISRFSNLELIQYSESEYSSATSNEDFEDPPLFGEETIKSEKESSEDTHSFRKSKSDVRYALDIISLKENFPEFVYEDEDGNASIDYIGMIPLLVQTIGDMRLKIEELQKDSTPKKIPASTRRVDAQKLLSDAVMGQNKPNPFGSSTEISLAVPHSVKDASLIICDLNGKLQKRIDLAERGKVMLTINTSDLYEGMFLYSLVADGEILATRKMIVM